MEEKKKKTKALVTSLIIIAGIAIAVTIGGVIQFLVKAGTVKVDKINLQLKDADGKVGRQINDWEPGDAIQVSWKVKNIGTAAVYTRNKLQIYWNEEINTDSLMIYLYPANMSKQEISNDMKKGEDSEYMIEVEAGDIVIDDEGTTKMGFEYSFNGDTLDGTKMTGKSKEVDYNLQSNVKTTDDNSATEDDIAFNIYFNPKSSYLYEGKTLTVKVVTEAMQCTEDGRAEWQIVDTQSIGG